MPENWNSVEHAQKLIRPGEFNKDLTSQRPGNSRNLAEHAQRFYQAWGVPLWVNPPSLRSIWTVICTEIHINCSANQRQTNSGNSNRQLQPETRLSRGGGEQNNWKWIQICLGLWLFTVDCIVYSDIFNTFDSPYLHTILSMAIIETPECQHCTVWQWAAFRAQGNGKFQTITQTKFDLNLSGK